MNKIEIKDHVIIPELHYLGLSSGVKRKSVNQLIKEYELYITRIEKNLKILKKRQKDRPLFNYDQRDKMANTRDLFQSFVNKLKLL